MTQRDWTSLTTDVLHCLQMAKTRYLNGDQAPIVGIMALDGGWFTALNMRSCPEVQVEAIKKLSAFTFALGYYVNWATPNFLYAAGFTSDMTVCLRSPLCAAHNGISFGKTEAVDETFIPGVLMNVLPPRICQVTQEDVHAIATHFRGDGPNPVVHIPGPLGDFAHA